MKLHAIFWVTVVLIFLFPMSLDAQVAAGKSKFLGNIWSAGVQPGNFMYYWNQVTPGVSGKWSACEQNRDDMNYWTWLDRCYNSSVDNNLIFKEHCLFWGHADGTPSWICNLPVAEQKVEAEEWVQELAGRYADMDLVDVVNEPLHQTPCFIDAIGGKGTTGWDWVIWCFQTARKYCTGKLILNDYNILGYDSGTTDFLVIINVLKDRGLIDGIGVQGHSLESTSIATIKGNLDRLGATGLPIYVSEYECNLADDSAQLAKIKEQFTAFWEHPSVQGITMWGYVQGDMWRADAWLVSSDGTTERPALKWIREYLGGDPNVSPPPTETPSPVPTATPTPTPVIVDCAGVAEWSSTATYSDAGIKVVYNNKLYETNWYSSGQNPEQNSGDYQVWTLIGECSGSVTAVPGETATPVATPTVAPTLSPGAATGDVNSDGLITIVDALLVAQYYVGLDPQNFNANAADANCDGSVNIVDALLVAQFYVGLVTVLC